MITAQIVKVLSVEDIQGSDNISKALVLGYQTVIKKNAVKAGDLAVFVFGDTIVPDKPQFEFLRKQNFRIKVMKLRGVVSQGLLLPLSDFPQLVDVVEGQDVGAALGILKYSKPVPTCLAGVAKGGFPSFIIKTDEENIRSTPEILEALQGRYAYCSVKRDGSSATFYLKEGTFCACSRNLELERHAGSIIWRLADELKIEEFLRGLDRDYAIQGECFGEGIQSNKMGVKGVKFEAFSLFDISKHKYVPLGPLKESEFPCVPQVEAGVFNYSLDDLIKMANELNYENGRAAEGIVIATYDDALPTGKISGKNISERFALKHGE